MWKLKLEKGNNVCNSDSRHDADLTVFTDYSGKLVTFKYKSKYISSQNLLSTKARVYISLFFFGRLDQFRSISFRSLTVRPSSASSTLVLIKPCISITIFSFPTPNDAAFHFVCKHFVMKRCFSAFYLQQKCC